MVFYILLIAGLSALSGYLALRALLPPLLNFFDKANSNNRHSLPTPYEAPRYYIVNSDGRINTAKKWPGWDGWYFLTLLGTQNSAQLIRGSIMTGLYGIEGIDNYDKLMLYLSCADVAECLFMLPQPRITLLHHDYLPKHPNLQMQPHRLDVKVTGHGEVTGSWPNYCIRLSNPQDELELSLDYKARDIIWWADLPGFFTYFTTFGHMGGELKKEGKILQKISSMGSFEHGYAKKWFDYDLLFIPVRLWKRLFPFNAIHYHYDLLFTEEGLHGGIMRAKGFGIEVRNRGGVYLPGGKYTRIRKIKHIKYERPKPMAVHCTARSIDFYEQWHVEAETEQGTLSYTARQVYPPAHIAKHMIFYSFLFEGFLGNQRLAGQGYGEYARM